MTFQAWIKRHRHHFGSYEAWEIARIALAAGFTMAEIAPDACTWITVSRRKLAFWDNPLMRQWVELWAYERAGKYFDGDSI